MSEASHRPKLVKSTPFVPSSLRPKVVSTPFVPSSLRPKVVSTPFAPPPIFVRVHRQSYVPTDVVAQEEEQMQKVMQNELDRLSQAVGRAQSIARKFGFMEKLHYLDRIANDIRKAIDAPYRHVENRANADPEKVEI